MVDADYTVCNLDILSKCEMTTFLIKKGGELDPRCEGQHTEAEGGERGSCCSQYSGKILNIPNMQVTFSIFPIFR